MQCRFSKLRSIFQSRWNYTVQDQNLMDAGRVLCESEHEKGPHKPNFFRKSKWTNMLSTLPWSLWSVVALLPLATESLHHHLWLFTRLFVVVWVSTSGRFATKSTFGFMRKVLVSTFHCYDSEHVFYLRCCHCFNRGTWRLIKTLAACSCGLSQPVAGKYGYHLPRP
jgi:hypothetical protein